MICQSCSCCLVILMSLNFVADNFCIACSVCHCMVLLCKKNHQNFKYDILNLTCIDFLERISCVKETQGLQ